ncbi:hypothetical protein EDC04DRAFT_2656780 [Pisolithus marmoratus]|nr:hypothetical protein EDC04DRAFT_2656780 [Pisolithus marmoratus]
MIQAMLMTRVLRQPRLKKYLLGTQTSLYTSLCFLDHLIPNDIPVWNSFKETISQRLCDKGEASLRSPWVIRTCSDENFEGSPP